MSATILLADDSLTIQKVVELTFADTDHDVVTVSSGDELLGKLDEVTPDLVICDVIMPGTDGYEVCQSLKSRPATLHIPVVLLTGTFEPFDRDRALAAGADEIITKPFEARRLVEAVEKLLAKRSAPAAEQAAATPMSFEGEVPPPVFDEGDGLDFTTTGFAEMEAAGEAQLAESQAPGEAPAEGLDMSFSGMPGPQPGDSGEAFEDVDEPEEPWTEGAEVAHTADIEGEEEGGANLAEEASFVDEPSDELAPDSGEGAPMAAEPSQHDEAEFFVDAEPVGADSDAFEEPEETSPPELATAPLEAPQPLSEAGEEPPPPTSIPIPTPAGEPDGSPSTPASLSDEDVERIARRVVELASGTLERIAWEVIPDMAELVVRERVRQLEAEIQREQDETPQ